MPIKFSDLSGIGLEGASKIVALRNDETSETNLSNCLVEASDFAKSTRVESINDSAVHKAGEEDISGVKKFNNTVYLNQSGSTAKDLFCLKSSSLDVDNAPTAYNSLEMHWKDKNDVAFGIDSLRTDNGSVFRNMHVRAHNSNTWQCLGVGFDASDNVYTYAPTPSNGSNDTNIATTNWCTDPAKSTNIVHRSGDETITGNKTFNNNIVLGSTSTLNGTDGVMTAKTKGVTNNSTNVATTAFSQTLIRKYFGKTQPTLHTLFSNDSGLATGNATLSEPFTNYDIILAIVGSDSAGEYLSYTMYPTWLLNYLMSYASKSVGFVFNGSQYWYIYSYAQGSSTTFFKERTENSRLYKIIGINMDGS